MIVLYKYIYKTKGEFSNIMLTSDGEYLTGLWFENSKDSNKHMMDYIEKELEIFKETSNWLDMYFSGKNFFKYNNFANYYFDSKKEGYDKENDNFILFMTANIPNEILEKYKI